MTQWGLFQGFKTRLIFEHQPVDLTHHICRLKREKVHDYINERIKTLDKIQHLSITKAFWKIGIENILDLRKSI